MTRREFVHRQDGRGLFIVSQQLLAQGLLVMAVGRGTASLRVQHALLLLEALLLEEQSDVVHGEDDALAVRLLCVNVHASHEHRVGAVEQRQEQDRHAVRHQITEQGIV